MSSGSFLIGRRLLIYVLVVVAVLSVFLVRSRFAREVVVSDQSPKVTLPATQGEPVKVQERVDAPKAADVPAPIPEPGPVVLSMPSAPVAAPVSVEEIQKAIEKVKQELGGRPKMLGEELKRMAMKSDFDARVVLALANEEWSADPAVVALGLVKFPALKGEVQAVLWGKTRGSNVGLVCEALRSYGMVGGVEAAPKLGEYIAGNYRRPDGFGEPVCTAAAEALGEIQGEASLEVLLNELKRGRERDWLPDYGSKVVVAVGRHDLRTAGMSWMPETRQVGLRGKNKERIRQALLEYADSLRAKLPGPTNPIGQQYLEEKIEEAVKLAGGAGK